MIFPKGNVIHSNLYTAYLEITHFIDNLVNDEFTGYLEVNFWEYKAYIFFDNGNMINAIEESGSNQDRKVGKEAFQSVLAKCKEKDGEISVHQLNSERTVTLATITGGNLLKDLSTDYVNLDKLISKVEQEEDWGYIQVSIREGEGKGLIFFGEGVIQEAAFATETGFLEGDDSITAMVDVSNQQGADFGVYQTVLDSAYLLRAQEIEEGPVDVVSLDFVDAVTTELTKILGPMAGIILDEKIEELGATPEKLPRTMLNKLLELLEPEVNDPAKMKEFTENFFDALQKNG